MLELIVPDWPLKNIVSAFSTTRTGGFSPTPYDSLNLGAHVGDDIQLVNDNRALLPLAESTIWLNQVHGSHCIEVQGTTEQCLVADAAFTTESGLVCGVMTADCVPVLLASPAVEFVAAIHAGWRGLSEGVIQNSINKIPCSAEKVVAWIGPCIGKAHFEVGEDVKGAFGERPDCFKPSPNPKRYMADIKSLCAHQLERAGVQSIYVDPSCTYSQPERFFSHRYSTHHGKGITGRMFTGIALTS